MQMEKYVQIENLNMAFTTRNGPFLALQKHQPPCCAGRIR